jgi:hypothetical protein
VSANHILQNFLPAENFPEWKCALMTQATNDNIFLSCSSECDLTSHGSRLVIKQYGESKVDTSQVMKLLTKQAEFVSIKKFVTFIPEIEDVVLKEPKTKKSPVVFKEYGKGMVQKVRKGRQRIKRTSSGTAKIELFVVALPDDTLNL